MVGGFVHRGDYMYLLSWRSKRDGRIYARICDDLTIAYFFFVRAVARPQYVFRHTIKIEVI